MPLTSAKVQLQTIQAAAGAHAEGGAIPLTAPSNLETLIKQSGKLQTIHAGHVKNFLAQNQLARS